MEWDEEERMATCLGIAASQAFANYFALQSRPFFHGDVFIILGDSCLPIFVDQQQVFDGHGKENGSWNLSIQFPCATRRCRRPSWYPMYIYNAIHPYPMVMACWYSVELLEKTGQTKCTSLVTSNITHEFSLHRRRTMEHSDVYWKQTMPEIL